MSPSGERNATRFSPSSRTRAGGPPGSESCSLMNAGIQYRRSRLPMGVPGPTRVSVMTSCATAIESSFLGASLPKGAGKQNTAPDRKRTASSQSGFSADDDEQPSASARILTVFVANCNDLAGSAGLPEKETARAPIQLSTRISGHAINPPPRIRAGVDYDPIVDRPPLRWPDNARVALWLCPAILDYEFVPPRDPWLDPWARTAPPDVVGCPRERCRVDNSRCW